MADNNRFAVRNFQWLDPFVPSRWWPGGWLQTLSVKSIQPEISTDRWEGCVQIQVPGQNTPPDLMSGYYLPPPNRDTDKPTTILFHGMGGHARSGYMLSLAETLLTANYPVVLWNHRGAGESAETCSGLHHPGATDDVKLLLRYLQQERSEWAANGFAAIAFSLGANLLLSYLAETAEDSQLRAAISISAPLDMETTSRNLRCGWNRLFDRYLLFRQRQEILRENAKLSEQERKTIANVNSVWELDDQFTGPRFDFRGAAEYYQANSAIHVLEKIRTPTLFFHALDDPVVDSDVFVSRDWEESGPLFPALADSGGHTGFLDQTGKRWHEYSSVQFIDRVISGSLSDNAERLTNQ